MTSTGAQILIQELMAQGVEVIFGYPGGTVLDIYDELYQHQDKIRHVLTAHEQGAAHAADGYARASGKVGVVLATSGPGSTNLVTGIANAYLDSVPLVAITGNVTAPLLGKDSFQEVDIVGITQPVVKHNFVVRDVSVLKDTIREAFEIARSGRPGPVLVDICKTAQNTSCEYKRTRITKKSEAAAELSFAEIKELQERLEEALAAIAACKRPYIYCGGGVVAAGAEDEVLELSKRLHAPVGLSMMGLTAVPHDYELNLGMTGMHGRHQSSRIHSQADVIIAVGVRFSDRATGDVREYAKDRTIIHIDIDEAEVNKNVPVDIALIGDAKHILQALLQQVKPAHNKEWAKTIAAVKAGERERNPKKFTPQAIIRKVNEYFGPETVVATDVGQHQMWVMQNYVFEKPRTLLTSGGLGTMGFGMGAAIGGCFASRKKRTLLFTSDGSFGMNLAEMATAVTQKLPLVIVLLNNGTLGMVRQWQTMFYAGRYSQTTLERKTDFVALARAFGAEGYAASSTAELEEILAAKLPKSGPVLIDCHISIDERVLPMIPPGGTINDIVLD
ncbi:MAG: biosynthetic-type acetolactate synthase large subunit [Actinomycetia bacterium]|nr:biosynthetic-type acetolactate synthase large subunit [Actinomycetes bacterium]